LDKTVELAGAMAYTTQMARVSHLRAELIARSPAGATRMLGLLLLGSGCRA